MSMTIAPPAANGTAAGSLPILRLSVDQYHDMMRAGILDSGDPIELLEGLLVLKMSKNPPHVYANSRLDDLLSDLVPAGWFVNSQDPITTLESEPEPDASVVRGSRRDFLKGHPKPKDVAMIGEVSDSTLEYDQGIKKRIYARAAIPVYWIVNLEDRSIEVYSDPTGPADEPDYRKHEVYGENDQAPLVLDGQEVGRIAVKDVLP
ncbi:MAG: Uma2 family endonuclease [Planctomycetes bacterium]|nr:Uma2 family endonuclease [Planctomycetota bacterium]